MTIKNEFTKIITDKEIVLHNYIYDEYLEAVAKAQYDKDFKDFSMNGCYLKFDTAFDDITNKTPEDFDMTFGVTTRSINGKENGLDANYTFIPTENGCTNPSTREPITDFSDYYGKRITAIGFSSDAFNETKIMACIDTSNYSIYFQRNICFQRKDAFKTDTIASSGFPANLAPFSDKTINIESGGHGTLVFNCYPVLYSIGLGTRKGEMQEEFVIGEDVDVIVESDTSFGFNLRKGLEPNKHPFPTLYAKSGLFPLPLKVSKEVHPHVTLYAGNNRFPFLSDYKYIIYKYRYYYFHDYAYEYRWTDDYFTLNLPNDTKGLFEIVTKIERSDV